jgi:CHAT domain-containing protein/lipopolysaccharide biosynthesis regulator YciM
MRHRLYKIILYQIDLILLLFCSLFQSVHAAELKRDVFQLRVNQAIEQKLSKEEIHTYQLIIGKDQYCLISVETEHGELITKITAPNHTYITKSYSNRYTKDFIDLIASKAGTYNLTIGQLGTTKEAISYKIKIEELRKIESPKDRYRVLAQQLFIKGIESEKRENAISRREAIRYLEQALTHWNTLQDREKQLWTTINLANIHLKLAEPNIAGNFNKQALSIAQGLNNGEIEAIVLESIGRQYFQQGELDRALENFNRSLELRSSNDRYGKALSLSGIGSVYRSKSEWTKALTYFNNALSIFKYLGSIKHEATTLINIGRTIFPLKDTQGALNTLTQGLNLARKIRSKEAEAYALRSIGNIYEEIGEWDRSIEAFNRALRLLHELGDKHGEGYSLHHLGNIYRESDKQEKALETFKEVLKIRRETGDKAGEYRAIQAIAAILINLKKPQEALNQLNSILPFIRDHGDQAMQASVLNSIGSAYSLLGIFDKALEYHQKALVMRRAIGNRRTEAKTIYGIAEIYHKLGNYDMARREIEYAIETIESFGATISSPDMRAAYVSTVYQYQDFYIDLLMKMHERRPSEGFDVVAFQASARARARSLVSMLMESGISFQNRIDTSQVIEGSNKQTTTSYSELIDPVALNLEEMQQMLDSDTALLQYALGNKRSFLWVLTNSSFTAYVLPKSEDIIKTGHRFYQSITARTLETPSRLKEKRWRSIIDSERKLSQTTNELSQILLKEAAPQLLGKNRLVIIPDSILVYIPFSALYLPKSNIPLIMEKEIISVPSMSVLSVLRNNYKKRRPAPKRVAIFADPIFTKDDWRVTSKVKLTSKNISEPKTIKSSSDIRSLRLDPVETGFEDREPLELSRLPYTRDLAEFIIKSTTDEEVMMALDFKANRSLAISGELEKYRMIIFATHAQINHIHPEQSRLVLSVVKENGEHQDGFLKLSDIYRMRLNAQLVVLGACETGLGKDLRGEGFIGLTRGFMYAGAATVLSSMWKVDEEFTVELLKRFYKGIDAGKRASTSLREAQISMWNEKKKWKHPYYFSSFILQGDWK